MAVALLRLRCRRRPETPVDATVARGLEARGIEAVTFDFPLHDRREARAGSRSSMLRRRSSRSGTERRQDGWLLVCRRQVDGRTHASQVAAKNGFHPAPLDSCCSAIRCIRRASRTSAATNICRQSRSRCCSCTARATVRITRRDADSGERTRQRLARTHRGRRSLAPQTEAPDPRAARSSTRWTAAARWILKT